MLIDLIDYQSSYKKKLLTSDKYMDLRKVSKIPQRHKDITFGYIKRVQLTFPTDNTYFNIVDLIQHLILLYFHQTLDSRILTDDEQKKFRTLWINHNKLIIDKEWKLIYRQTESIMSNDYFREKVYGKINVMIIIETQNGNVFGGYTKTGWDKNKTNYGHSADKDAFVFQIRSCHHDYEPFISSVKQDDKSINKALGYGYNMLAQFGNTWIFQLRFNQFEHKCDIYDSHNTDNYQKFKHNRTMLGGTFMGNNVIEMEVFQIQIEISI